jgi:hypothetical protein
MSGGGLGIDEEGELGIDGGGAETCWSVGAGPNESGTPGKHPTSVRGKAGDGPHRQGEGAAPLGTWGRRQPQRTGERPRPGRPLMMWTCSGALSEARPTGTPGTMATSGCGEGGGEPSSKVWACSLGAAPGDTPNTHPRSRRGGASGQSPRQVVGAATPVSRFSGLSSAKCWASSAMKLSTSGLVTWRTKL